VRKTDRRLQDIQEILDAHERRIERLDRSIGRSIPYSLEEPKSSGPTSNFPIALTLTIFDLILVIWCVFTILNPPTYTIYRQPLVLFGVTLIESGEVVLTDWTRRGLAWLGAIFGVPVLFFLIGWTFVEAFGG